MTIKYDADVINFINFFEKLTKASVKDVILKDDRLTFIVNEGQLRKAIGKNGVNIRKLEHMFKRRIRVVEFSSDVCEFVKNLLMPLEISNIYKENEMVKIKADGLRLKSILIGRDRRNLNHLKDIVKKYFKYDLEVV